MTIEDIDGIKEIGEFDDKYLYFECNDRKGICDKYGNILINKLFDNIIHINDSNLFIAYNDYFKNYIIYNDGVKLSLSKKSYINYKIYDGYLIMTEKYFNKAKTMITYYNSIIDKSGRELLRDKGIEIVYLQEDMFLIKSSDLLYIYNVKLGQVFELNNKSYNNYNGGYMLQKNNGKYRYLDKEGRVKLNFGTYDYATDFNKTMPSGKYIAILENNKKMEIKVIDNNGNTLCKLSNKIYDITDVKYDVIIIQKKKTGKYGLRDINGKEIAPCVYDNIDVTSNGICFCYINNNIRHCYTNKGKKIEIDNSLRYISDNNYSNVILLGRIIGYENYYIYMNKDGEFLFNGLEFDIKSDVFFHNARDIVRRREISYSANNICEYDKYSVVDTDSEDILFSYPNDKNFTILEDLYTDDYSYYIGVLKDEDKYLIIDEKGNEIKKINAIDYPLIKGNIVIFEYVCLDLEYKIRYGIYEILKNNEIRFIKCYNADSIDFISKDTFVVTCGDKRYLNIITRDSESNSVINEYDISYEKGLTEKVRKRLLSR